MNKNRAENITITIAPWLEQLLSEKKALAYQLLLTTHQESKSPVSDPAIFIGEVQVDEKTGKQYKNIITESGKQIRVPVQPKNDPDEPLYTQDEINRMGNYLLNRKGHNIKKLRDYAYFIFSINTWRRAGDNLGLTVGDVMNADGTFKDWLIIRHEQKTGKKTSTPINSAVKNALKMYLGRRKGYSSDDLLFPANFQTGERMTVDGMCLVFKRAAKALGITRKIGTHSLRKTGALQYVMMAKDKGYAERQVSQLFGHSSITITRRYLMLEQEELRRNFEDRKLEVK